MALTIYGSPRSRTMRTLWAAAELELAYHHVPLGWDDPELKSDWFRRINPMGTIPAIVDDGVTLGESMAINLYLAKRYGPAGESRLYPIAPEAEAEVWRWSLWAQGHLEPWVQQDASVAWLRERASDQLDAAISSALTTLDGALAERSWLAGDCFTVADLNVAGVLSPSRTRVLDLSAHAHIRAWLDRCYSRPACRATRARFAG